MQQVLAQALQYRFASLSQFKAILESEGYECFEKDGRLCVKRSGRILGAIPIESLITKYRLPDEAEQKRKNQLRAILRKYRRMQPICVPKIFFIFLQEGEKSFNSLFV